MLDDINSFIDQHKPNILEIPPLKGFSLFLGPARPLWIIQTWGLMVYHMVDSTEVCTVLKIAFCSPNNLQWCYPCGHASFSPIFTIKPFFFRMLCALWIAIKFIAFLEQLVSLCFKTIPSKIHYKMYVINI